MIESSATFTVTFPGADQAKWEALIEGLSLNRHGAYLEEYAEAFGAEAEQAVSDVLDIWDEARDEIDTRASHMADGKAIVVIVGYDEAEKSAKPMARFLEACGALQIERSTYFESEHH